MKKRYQIVYRKVGEKEERVINFCVNNNSEAFDVQEYLFGSADPEKFQSYILRKVSFWLWLKGWLLYDRPEKFLLVLSGAFKPNPLSCYRRH